MVVQSRPHKGRNHGIFLFLFYCIGTNAWPFAKIVDFYGVFACKFNCAEKQQCSGSGVILIASRPQRKKRSNQLKIKWSLFSSVLFFFSSYALGSKMLQVQLTIILMNTFCDICRCQWYLAYTRGNCITKRRKYKVEKEYSSGTLPLHLKCFAPSFCAYHVQGSKTGFFCCWCLRKACQQW